MTILSKGIEIKGVPLGDITLLGIRWINAETDLEFHCQMHSAYKNFPEFIYLHVEFATEVRIDLDFGDKRMGAPFSYGFDIDKDENGRYKAVIDFGGAPEGEISFSCNDISISTEPLAP